MEVIKKKAKIFEDAIEKKLNDTQNPVNYLKIGDEVYQLVADHSAMREIARLTGIHPYVQGNLTQVLNLPDGLEICLYAMLVKPGPKHQLPRKQRNLSRRIISDWFEQAEDQFEFWQRAGDAVFMTFLQDTRSKKKIEPESEAPEIESAEESDPTKLQQTP